MPFIKYLTLSMTFNMTAPLNMIKYDYDFKYDFSFVNDL